MRIGKLAWMAAPHEPRVDWQTAAGQPVHESCHMSLLLATVGA